MLWGMNPWKCYSVMPKRQYEIRIFLQSSLNQMLRIILLSNCCQVSAVVFQFLSTLIARGLKCEVPYISSPFYLGFKDIWSFVVLHDLFTSRYWRLEIRRKYAPLSLHSPLACRHRHAENMLKWNLLSTAPRLRIWSRGLLSSPFYRLSCSIWILLFSHLTVLVIYWQAFQSDFSITSHKAWNKRMI